MSIFRMFPVPKYLQMPMVGIDISQFSVRVMSFIKEADQLKVNFFDSKQLKIPLNLSEDISKHTELVSILQEWKKTYNLEFVEASLPEERAYIFETKVARASEAEMRAAIEFDLEENVPISPAEAVFDFRLIGSAGEDDVVVAVTVLPEEIVQTYIHLFELAGLTAVSFLIEPQALSKAVIKANDKDAYLVVHIGELKTGLFVVAQDSVQFTSTIQIGSRSFSDAISKALGITFDEAEKIKMKQGFVKSKENTEILSALSGAASVFKEEIEKVFVYWHSRKGVNADKSNIKKIILGGHNASLPGLSDFIGQAIKIEVEVANVWQNVASFDDYIPPIPFADSLQYGASIGLALPHMDVKKLQKRLQSFI